MAINCVISPIAFPVRLLVSLLADLRRRFDRSPPRWTFSEYLQWQDRDDAIKVHAINLADGEVFAGFELLAAEMVAGFVGSGSRYIVVKPPASTRAVHEMAEIVFAVRTLAYNAAGLPVLPPGVRIDPRLSVKWCNHDVRRLAITFGV